MNKILRFVITIVLLICSFQAHAFFDMRQWNWFYIGFRNGLATTYYLPSHIRMTIEDAELSGIMENQLITMVENGMIGSISQSDVHDFVHSYARGFLYSFFMLVDIVPHKAYNKTYMLSLGFLFALIFYALGLFHGARRLALRFPNEPRMQLRTGYLWLMGYCWLPVFFILFGFSQLTNYELMQGSMNIHGQKLLPGIEQKIEQKLMQLKGQ